MNIYAVYEEDCDGDIRKAAFTNPEDAEKYREHLTNTKEHYRGPFYVETEDVVEELGEPRPYYFVQVIVRNRANFDHEYETVRFATELRTNGLEVDQKFAFEAEEHTLSAGQFWFRASSFDLAALKDVVMQQMGIRFPDHPLPDGFWPDDE